MTAPDQPILPEQRSGRHAARRTPVRLKLRGRALAMAAVPTALLMAAAYAPTSAVADPAADKPCASAPDAPPQVAETPVPKSEIPPPKPTAPTAPSAPAGTPAAPAPTAAPTAPATQAPSAAPAPSAATPTGAPTTPPVVRSSVTDGGPVLQPQGIVDDILGGLGRLVNPGSSASPTATAAPTPAATPTPTTAPAPAGTPAAQPPAQPPVQPAPQQRAAAPAQPAAPAAATTAAGSPTAKARPNGRVTGTPSAGPKAGATPAATPSASPTAGSNCPVDISALAAPSGADNPILVPDQNWTLRTTRLALDNSRFHGVVDVRTPSGTKRVLKFVVDNVEIDNLDMSTLEGNGRTFHVKGGPGTTSTMRKGPVTMYVERLSGHLSKVIGLPVPIDLGEITLTPDTLPQWLYDLLGTFPIPLDLELTGVTAVQAGQFGGTLRIPGMKMYNDDTPYVGAK